MDRTAFEGWLESVSATFLSLNDQQRNQCLDQLISLSGAAQLRHLSNGLETLLKRDFLRLLPLELAFYLLRWLDPQTLLTCCLVCKQWNKVKIVLSHPCCGTIETFWFCYGGWSLSPV
ncbi:F-box/WD repeat-containing protein 2 [Xenoophorus captivus]|uniref:F-box/WD repeat-containing protein 2 n=1 Tax=Xenoophorus captivus TaxID=1517983 RepID=A0ABV0S8V0_9TELE